MTGHYTISEDGKVYKNGKLVPESPDLFVGWALSEEEETKLQEIIEAYHKSYKNEL